MFSGIVPEIVAFAAIAESICARVLPDGWILDPSAIKLASWSALVTVPIITLFGVHVGISATVVSSDPSCTPEVGGNPLPCVTAVSAKKV